METRTPGTRPPWKRVRALVLGSVLLVGLPVFVSGIVFDDSGYLSGAVTVGIQIAYYIAAFIALTWMTRWQKRQLAQEFYVEDLGWLLEMLLPRRKLDTGPTNRRIVRIVTPLLEKLNQENLSQIDSPSAERLYRFLARPREARDEEFALAIAQSLLRTRDTRALPHVRKATEKIKGDARWDSRVETALKAAHPILEAQKEKERQAEQLLRPAELSDASVLVRAAENSGANDTDHLPRLIEDEPNIPQEINPCA